LPTLSSQLLISTPRGSTIEVIGHHRYWVCDATRSCREVKGLWTALQLVRRSEVFRRSIDSVGVDTGIQCREATAAGSISDEAAPSAG
jgi:hypothetical protein